MLTNELGHNYIVFANELKPPSVGKEMKVTETVNSMVWFTNSLRLKEMIFSNE